jgi:uncharacterized protein YjbI with pentapeptide repeats
MEKKLQNFLDEAFAPYGDFPARADVTQELLANLLEKYNDLKQRGKTDDEAYKQTIDSFGDVSEIMENIPHVESNAAHDGMTSGIRKMIADGVKAATGNDHAARASALSKADLTDTDLSGKDFSGSALMEASFDRSDAREAKFKGAALRSASFVETNLRGAVFAGADLQNANFNNADLTNATFKGAALKGVTLNGSKLTGANFSQSDVSGVSFDGFTLNDVRFDSASLKGASFKKAVLHNVSFHHAAVKHAIFDGSSMDKLTYALLKGAKATLNDITIL